MSEPWELTDEEIKHYTGRFLTYRDECQCDGCKGIRNLLPAAIQKYRNWLASKYDHDPCKTCSSWRTFGEVSRCTWFTLRSQCLNWVEYQGTLAGYSKAMQEMEAKLEAERAKAKAEGAWMVVDEMIAFLDCQGHKRPEGV